MVLLHQTKYGHANLAHFPSPYVDTHTACWKVLLFNSATNLKQINYQNNMEKYKQLDKSFVIVSHIVLDEWFWHT